MKHLFFIISFICWGCNAQSPVYSLFEKGYGYNQSSGVYYKDTNNDFNKVAGTWKYQNGNVSFTIVLQKIMFYDADEDIYADMLFGQYRYTDASGNEIVNTIPSLDNTNPFNNNIYGLLLSTDENDIFSRKIKLNFIDPERSYINKSIIIKYIKGLNNNPDKVELQWSGNTSSVTDDTSPTDIRVPVMNYTLIKQ